MKSACTLIIAAALAGLCACQTPAPPTPVAYVPPPPPPPPPEPPPLIVLPKDKALAGLVFEEAAAFREAMLSSASISESFADGGQVAAGLRKGAAYEPRQLQRGAVAYVAVVALGHPAFADSFREYSIDDEARARLVKMIIERPDYAASFPGADKAAGLAITQLDALGAGAWRQGRAVQQAAYDVQRQPWGKEQVAGRDLRLEEAKALSAQSHAADAAAAASMRTIALTEPAVPLISTPVSGPYTEVVNRGLAIAALAALGEAGEPNLAAVKPLLDEPASFDCLQSAKLMYFQCLASADRGHYEDIFCLGAHAMAETGQCVVKAAGSPTPAFTPPPPPPPPVAAPKAKAKTPARRPAAKRR